MLGVLNIINKYFWKSWSGPFFTFAIAPLVMIVSMSLYSSPIVILANALSIPIICCGATIVPQTIHEFKSSVILKRIGVSDVRPVLFMVAVFVYFTSFMVVSVVLNLLISVLYVYLTYGNDPAFGKVDYFSIYNSADYASWAMSQLLTIALALSVGFFASSVLRSVLAIQTTGIVVIIVAMFVGGALVPFSMVADNGILRSVSYLLPFRYTSALGIESWFANVNGLFADHAAYGIDAGQFGIQPADTAAAILGKLNDSAYGAGVVPGRYVLDPATGNYVFGSLNPLADPAIPENEFYVTFVDSGKGFVYQTTIARLRLGGVLLPEASLFNFDASNVWQINNPFMQVISSMGTTLKQDIPDIKEVFAPADKALSFAMPWVFMLFFFGVAAANFKWNVRG